MFLAKVKVKGSSTVYKILAENNIQLSNKLDYLKSILKVKSSKLDIDIRVVDEDSLTDELYLNMNGIGVLDPVEEFVGTCKYDNEGMKDFSPVRNKEIIVEYQGKSVDIMKLSKKQNMKVSSDIYSEILQFTNDIEIVMNYRVHVDYKYNKVVMEGYFDNYIFKKDRKESKDVNYLLLDLIFKDYKNSQFLPSLTNSNTKFSSDIKAKVILAPNDIFMLEAGAELLRSKLLIKLMDKYNRLIKRNLKDLEITHKTLIRVLDYIDNCKDYNQSILDDYKNS